MKKRLVLVLVLAAILLLVFVLPVLADGPVTLPDWGSAIGSQTNGFLGWSAISGPVQFVIGIAMGSIGISLLMRIFLRGG